ncbi:MAG: thermonuclease family protein [Hasllibacter sp.]
MLRLRSLFVPTLVALVPLIASAETVTGRIERVIDGDSFELREGSRLIDVRLHGIDAPERDQACTLEGRDWACGAAVTRAARAAFEGRVATCERVDTDRYGRMVALCRADGRDIGRTLVRSGLATAYARYSSRYAADERAAAAARRGIHAGGFTAPAAHRVARIAGTRPPDPACAIKGNISANGRIYHLPGSRSYPRTGIDEDEGERWFCSVEEALAAGWRAPRG